MTTTAVVKHFDIFEQIGLRVLMRLIARGVNLFVLQSIKEAFRRGIDSNDYPRDLSSNACCRWLACVGTHGSRISCLYPNDTALPTRGGGGTKPSSARPLPGPPSFAA